MAASTTVKVATLTGAAKDDVLTSALTGLTEDNLSANLNVLANDPGAARLFSLLQSTAGLTSTTQFPVVNTATTANGATITMNADGTISYNASTLNASLQSYGLGETFTDTFTYTVRMANGALSTAKATVLIAGTNDAPTLASVAKVSILDTAADDTPAAATGSLAGADVDHGAMLSYSFADGSQSATNEYGTITLDAATGAYSFLADPDKIDALADGASANASFSVVVSDEHGAKSAAVTLSFDLVGANDTAAISGNVSGAVAEDGATGAAGTLTVADRDAGQSSFQAAGALAGTYGDFTFDNATGEWTYALRNDADNVQSLTGGQAVADSLIVTSLDGSASETIQVSITGTNDIAAFGGAATGNVAEDGSLSTGGTLTVFDRDTGETGFQAPSGVAGAFGDFTFDTTTGNWTYALRNGDANVQALTAAAGAFDELVITSLDGSASQTIHVAIAGADEPVVIVPTELPPEPVSTVKNIKVTHGRTDVNANQIVNGFDSDDNLLYANNYTFKNFTTIDTDGVNGVDSTLVNFDFTHGRDSDPVTVTLVGYIGLTADHVLATNMV